MNNHLVVKEVENQSGHLLQVQLMEKLTVRAITAYYRSLKAGQEEVPVQAEIGRLDGRAYVLLRDKRSEQLLAIYRCMNRGELKRLKRWPAELLAPPALAEPASSPNLPQLEVPAPLLLLDLVPLPRKAPTDAQDGPGCDQADLF